MQFNFRGVTFLLKILTIVSMMLVTPAGCPHALAGGKVAAPDQHIMTHDMHQHDGHMSHDMDMKMSDASQGHGDHGCGDECDGGVDCSSCMLMTALPVLPQGMGQSMPRAQISLYPDEMGVSLIRHPEPPPPRA